MFKHDLKNHLIIIQGYLHNKNLKQLSEYLDNLGAEYSEILSGNISSGNELVDIVVAQKVVVAKTEGIKVCCNIEPIGHIPILEVKLTSLLGNLWDNAIEACMKLDTVSRFIDFNLYEASGMFAIQMANSSPDDYIYDKNLKLLSSKRDNRKGLGLEQIEQIAKNGGGWQSVTIENGMFIIKVFLPLKKGDSNNEFTNGDC